MNSGRIYLREIVMRVMPSDLRMAAPAAEPAVCVEVQHKLAGPPAPEPDSHGAGVATAKRGRARIEKVARRENILESEVCLVAKGTGELFAEDCCRRRPPFYTRGRATAPALPGL